MDRDMRCVLEVGYDPILCLRRNVPHGPVIKVFFSGKERIHPHRVSHHPWKQAACMVSRGAIVASLA
jgi:hypothetical protein